MNVFYRISGRTVSARTAIIVFLFALMPVIWGMALPFSRVVFRSGLLGWERGVFEWTNIPPEAKIVIISGYVFVIAITLAISMAFLFLFKSKHAEVMERWLGRYSIESVAITVGALGVVSVTGFLLLHAHRLVFAYAIFAFEGAICAIVAILVTFRIKNQRSYHPVIAFIPLLMGITPLCYALLLTPYRVPNEFLALPEETILASGKYIDNIDFINSRHFEGMVIPDPRLKLTGRSSFSVKISVPQYIDSWEIEALQRNSQERFWYDHRNLRLEIHGNLKLDEFRFLSSFVQEDDRKRLAMKFGADLLESRVLANQRYGNDELEFLQLNLPELERQLVLGRFFYHHVFLFLPALTGVLDGAITHASQYGRGLTAFFAEVLKFTPENLRFNAYLALLYLSYPLYFWILLLTAAKLGLSRWGVIFVGAITLVGYLASDIETIRLGVGIAPWRHFFDVAVLFCLFHYVRRPTVATGILLTLITGFSVYWSREMGFFLAVAVIFGLVAHTVTSRLNRHWLIVGACTSAALLGYWLGDPKALSHATAVLLGINTPSLPAGFVQLLAGLVLLVGTIWLVRRPPSQPQQARSQHADWIFLGSSLVYFAIYGIYLLWYPRMHHLVPLIPLIGMAGAVAHRYYFFSVEESSTKIAATSIALALCALVLLGTIRSLELRQEARIFYSHVVHEWNLPNGQITSTGQPDLISNSVNLIRNHELGSSANILSPWEVVLLPFAGKYKAGPFLVSFDSLLSDTDVKQLAKYLVSSTDKVLFVDSRIINGQYELPLSKHAYMKTRIFSSTLRLAAHASLREVFDIIQPCYDLTEEGNLISVYKLKSTAKWDGKICTATEQQP